MKTTKAERQKKCICDLKAKYGDVRCPVHPEPEEQVGCGCRCHKVFPSHKYGLPCPHCQPQPADETGEWDIELADVIVSPKVVNEVVKTGEWKEEFDDKWVDEHAEVVKADPKQLKEWIYNLLSRQREEIRKNLEKYKCDFNWDFKTDKAKHKSYIALEDVLSALDKEEDERSGY